jgi:hypothetical protein
MRTPSWPAKLVATALFETQQEDTMTRLSVIVGAFVVALTLPPVERARAQGALAGADYVCDVPPRSILNNLDGFPA